MYICYFITNSNSYNTCTLSYSHLLIAGAIRAIVGIRVLNKTSDEYWFLMKFNLSHVDGNMEIKNVNIITEYFLIQLKTGSSRLVSFQLFQNFSINKYEQHNCLFSCVFLGGEKVQRG